MGAKPLRRPVLFALLSVLVAAVVLGSATYAWFTFTASTDVRDFRGSVSRGGADLFISAGPEGPFDVTCDLPAATADLLEPVSTADLAGFYTSAVQDPNGVTVLYRAVEDPDSVTLHGRVYLRVENAPCDVYLWPEGLDLGTDPQLLSALRLGLRVTDSRGTRTHIFALDALGDTSGAQSRRTTQQTGVVVSAVDDRGRATPVPDPAESLTAYFAQADGQTVLAGEQPLCTLEPGETATVEYRLWLEGCDENCFDPVRSRDIVLALGFAGV